MPSPLKKSFAAEQLKLRKKKKSQSLWILVFVVIIAVVIGGYVLYSRCIAIPVKAEIISIGMLPFENMSADEEQEYFCNGISQSCT